jgi:hypothetical protein
METQSVLQKVIIEKNETCLSYAIKRSAKFKELLTSKDLLGIYRNLENSYDIDKLNIPEKAKNIRPDGTFPPYPSSSSSLEEGDVFAIRNRFSDRELVISEIDEDGKVTMSYCTGGFHIVVLEKFDKATRKATFSSLSIKDFKPSIRVYDSKVLYETYGDGSNNLLLKALT